MKNTIRHIVAACLSTAILAAASMPSMAQNTYTLPLILSADNAGSTSFLRIINTTNESGTVQIHGIDDNGVRFGPASLAVGANAVVNFTSRELERGNTAKGISSGVGDGEGNWRLELTTALVIEPLVYIRTSDGFVTSMHDVAPTSGLNLDHYISFFNPGSNLRQVSRLRLVNPGSTTAEVTITGRDDAGEIAPRGTVRLTLLARTSRFLSAQTLESGIGLDGRLGDGAGKWRLSVVSNVAIQVMSILSTPTGHTTNLSTTPLHLGMPTEPETPTEGLTCCDFGRYTVDNVSWNQCSCWSSDDVQNCQDATYKFLSGPVVYGTPVESCPSYRRPYGQCCFTADGGVDEGRDAFGGTPVTSDFCECWSIPEDVTGWVCENSTIGPSISVASCPPPRSASSRGFAENLGNHEQRGMDFNNIVERINTPSPASQ